MDLLKTYKDAIMEIDSGKRSILIITTKKPGERYILTTEGLLSGKIQIQITNKGQLKEKYSQNIEEIFIDTEK